jgi:hypothetical protein
VRREPNFGFRGQYSDAGIGYRDEAGCFVIGMLWDAAMVPVFMRFLQRRHLGRLENLCAGWHFRNADEPVAEHVFFGLIYRNPDFRPRHRLRA